MAAPAALARCLTATPLKTTLFAGCGGRSSAWLEPQIVDLAVAGSNPVDHPISSLHSPHCRFGHILSDFDRICPPLPFPSNHVYQFRPLAARRGAKKSTILGQVSGGLFSHRFWLIGARLETHGPGREESWTEHGRLNGSAQRQRKELLSKTNVGPSGSISSNGVWEEYFGQREVL